MLKIRLMRIGAKKQPFYRVVVLDERAKRTGAYIELLGTYNPLTEPKDIQLKKDRIDYWIKQGAQPSTGYLRIIGKAPQRPPRKPKKEAKQAKGNTEQTKPEEPAKTEDTTATEETTPAEEPVKEAVSEEATKSSETEAVGEVESAPETETPQETPSNQKEEVMDDSAEKTESNETETSESVQNKNEGSA